MVELEDGTENKAKTKPKQPIKSAAPIVVENPMYDGDDGFANPIYDGATLPYAKKDTVEVAGKGKGKIRFLGPDHRTGEMKVGVRLFNPNGKNNGTVAGHKYFKCEDNYGVLVKPEKVTLVKSAFENPIHDGMDASPFGYLEVEAPATGPKPTKKKNAKAPSGDATLKSAGKNSVGDDDSGATLPYAKKDTVEVAGKGKGKIRFLGPDHRTGEMKVGVRLFNPNGKNNGTVAGHKYFKCEDNYGVLVKPDKATLVLKFNLKSETHDYRELNF